ncbi:MAG: DUF3800 domain-containing protein [Azospirillaceae bacterium]|nr:DUF3800 domain-containing protein [Azospirillaceae bacterium]
MTPPPAAHPRGHGTALNKKVLCFIDESGTAGSGDLILGALLVHARDAGHIDKCFSDLLMPNANEIHAVNLDDSYLQSLMRRFWESVARDRIVMINHKIATHPSTEGPALYAKIVVETVKIGLKRFQQDVLNRTTIGNVELIIDANHHNEHATFDALMVQAQTHDGHFRGVKRVVRLDSAAPRLLPVADAIAYSRKWIGGPEMNAQGLRDRFGIQIP